MFSRSLSWKKIRNPRTLLFIVIFMLLSFNVVFIFYNINGLLDYERTAQSTFSVSELVHGIVISLLDIERASPGDTLSFKQLYTSHSIYIENSLKGITSLISDTGENQDLLLFENKVRSICADIQEYVNTIGPSGHITLEQKVNLKTYLSYSIRGVMEQAVLISTKKNSELSQIKNRSTISVEILYSIIIASFVLGLIIIFFILKSIDDDDIERSQLEQRKTAFISMTSHELRTPLTSTGIYVHLLEKHIARYMDSHADEYVSKIKQQIERQTKLIRELLDISRIETGKIQIVKENVNFSNLLADIIESMQADSLTHKIITGIQPDIMIQADKDKMSQVVINLLSNALKYSPEQSPILVNVVRHQDHVVVAVKDYGKGIAKNHQKKIFEKFYRIEDKDTTHQGKYQGLGIGLYISAEIIRLHGGNVWVESEEGMGSTFYVTLPFRDIKHFSKVTLKKVSKAS